VSETVLFLLAIITLVLTNAILFCAILKMDKRIERYRALVLELLDTNEELTKNLRGASDIVQKLMEKRT